MVILEKDGEQVALIGMWLDKDAILGLHDSPHGAEAAGLISPTNETQYDDVAQVWMSKYTVKDGWNPSEKWEHLNTFNMRRYTYLIEDSTFIR